MIRIQGSMDNFHKQDRKDVQFKQDMIMDRKNIVNNWSMNSLKDPHENQYSKPGEARKNWDLSPNNSEGEWMSFWF